MEIQAVFFDLDETLTLERKSVERAFLLVCATARKIHGVDPAALCRAVIAEGRKLWRTSTLHGYCLAVGISSWEGLSGNFAGDGAELAVLRGWVPGYRVRAWSKALQSLGVDDPALAHELAEELVRERRNHHVAYSDAEPALRLLRRDRRLALLTNGAPEIQREKLRKSRLWHWFEVILVSAEVGAGKPDGTMFRLALEEMELQPSQVAMVGDSLTRDVIGAQRAGIYAVWLNRFGQERESGIDPEVEIRSLRELAGHLR